MPTLIEYANRMTGEDTELWRATVQRVPELNANSYWYSGEGTSPDQEVPFDAGALLLFALASRRRVLPAEIGLSDMRAWLAEHPSDTWIAALAVMLTDAGYGLLPPQRRRRRGGSGTGDPVVDTWMHLTYLFDPDALWWDGSDGPWPDPLLPAGLSAWQSPQPTPAAW